ncbi:MAG: hypothetical protein ACKVOL_02800 [Novosphingobium sp.]
MLHFAPRYGIVSPCLTRARKVRLGMSANDNGASVPGKQSGANDDIASRGDALLEAALKMFAAHGLSAARRACEAAEIAAAGEDREAADWWLAVCAMFDGALARSAARAFAARQSGRR